MLENIASCQRCKLHQCQAPLLDRPKKGAIMVVGISAKQANTKSEIPLDNTTRSGRLVEIMENISKQYDLEIYRTNLVKCPPLDQNYKIRYPTQHEIEMCFKNILFEIADLKPRIIILFGSLVQSTFSQFLKLDLKKTTNCSLPFLKAGTCYYVASYHPSYIMRSSLRKEQYLTNFSALLKMLFE